jgi:hypothetical protein
MKKTGDLKSLYITWSSIPEREIKDMYEYSSLPTANTHVNT